MTDDQLRMKILGALRDSVPGAEVEGLVETEDFRDQIDMDSMDFLNFALSIKKALGVDVPESDYRKIATLQGAIAYLQERVKK